jgi:V/A-type H+-transporting ATPase subunit C
MWSHLLGAEKLEQLVAAKDIEAQIRLLSETAYKPELEEALLQGHTVGAIDRALRDNLAHTVSKVLAMLPVPGVAMVDALLARWDIFDIKTIIRGVHAHSTQTEILDSLMPAATLSEAELGELAGAEDVQGVVDILATWQMPYARPLDQAMPAFRDSGTTAPLELAVDRWFFERASKQLAKGRDRDRVIVRRIMGTIVDTENLRTLFRIAGADFDREHAASFWLPGGSYVPEEMFVDLAVNAGDPDGVLDGIRRTPYSRPLEEAAKIYLLEGTLSVLERALENMFMHEVIACRRPDPLSIGIVVAFLWAKQNEVTNVRVAVTGRSVGLPEDRLRRELILV